MKLDPLTEEFIDGISFEDARNNLKNILVNTNLIYSKFFSDKYNNEIYIKPENLQVTGSFKIRGAYNTVAKLNESEKKTGIITSSAGNHAQGVAYAAKKLGVNATIVMPETTPLIKVQSTRDYGVNVVLHGDVYDDAYDKASQLQKEHQYRFIHPFNDINVIEGQGTIGLEIMEELEDVNYILVPIGGGGLISGVALAAKSINPDVKIIGVEPENAQSMKKSLEKDKIITLDTVNTIADGTAVKTPGTLNYYITKRYVDDIVTVSDLEVMEVFIDLIQNHKIIAENSGSLALAALKKLNIKNKKIVSLISGGNIDIISISDLVDKGLVSTGRIFTFAMDVLDKPGELEKVASILSKLGANIISVRHNTRASENIFTDVNLEVSVETNGPNHIDYICSELQKNGYELTRFGVNE